MQPFVTLLLALSAILTLIQNNSSRGANIFVISYLFSPWVWKTFSIIQFLFTPLIMLLEKKLSKGMFLTFSAYSLNVFLFALILGNKPKLYEVAVLSIIYLGAFILLLYVVDRKILKNVYMVFIIWNIHIDLDTNNNTRNIK